MERRNISPFPQPEPSPQPEPTPGTDTTQQIIKYKEETACPLGHPIEIEFTEKDRHIDTVCPICKRKVRVSLERIEPVQVVQPPPVRRLPIMVRQVEFLPND